MLNQQQLEQGKGGLINLIAYQNSVSKSCVSVVIAGCEYPIRKIPVGERAALISTTITGVAKLYGMRAELEEYMLDECMDLVNEKFKSIGLSEIKEAYKLWSTGALNLGKSAEMYGGEFNAAQLGKILGAYVEFRRSIVSKYLDDKHKTKVASEKKAKEEINRVKFEKEFPVNFKNAEFEKWEDVPSFWCDAARERGLMEISKQDYQRILKKAQKLAILKIEKDNESTNNIFNRIFSEEERSKIIAKQVAVFEFKQKQYYFDAIDLAITADAFL